MATVRLGLSFEFDPSLLGITDLNRSAEDIQADVVRAVQEQLESGRSLLIHSLFDVETARTAGLPDGDEIKIDAHLVSY